MKINLINKKTKLTLDSDGAYIEKFSYDKKDIFFPKFETEIKGKKKIRGGSHPCLPSFGPSEINDLKDHGYARNRDWDLVEKVIKKSF